MAEHVHPLPLLPKAIEDEKRRTKTERVWNLPEMHAGHSDVAKESTLTLRSDGTGHLSALIDNNDTWEFTFSAFRGNGAQLFYLPDSLDTDGRTRFHCDIRHRQIDFHWRLPETLFAIATITVIPYH